LVLATESVNTSLAEAAEPSVAVTLTSIAPTSPLTGVPEKAPVAGLNVSQAGSGLPLARVADRVRVSPTSTSAKVLAGTVNENAESSVAPWSARAWARVGASLV